MALIPDSVVDEVRERADLVEVIGEHTKLKRSGRTHRGPCPLHGGEGPNLSVDPAKGLFKCFVCGEGGTVYDFLMKHLGMDFPSAVRSLADRVGIVIPEPDVTAPPREDPNAHLYRINDLALRYFAGHMDGEQGVAARDYLVGVRGFDPATLREHELGFAPDAWDGLVGYMRGHAVDLRDLVTLGLVRHNADRSRYYDAYRGRIIFPIRDLKGRLVAFAGRAMPGAPDDTPKYVNSDDSPIYRKGTELYGLHLARNEIRRTGVAVVVEGYLDWLRLYAAGLCNVVAGSGTAFTEHQARLLARYAREAVTAYDGDGDFDVRTGKGTKGLKATFSTAEVLLAAGLRTRSVLLPRDADPDSFTRDRGIAELRAWVDAAKDVFEVRINLMARRGFFDSLTGRETAFGLLLPVVRGVADEVTRQFYVNRLSELSGISRVSIEMELDEDGLPRVALERQVADLRAALAGALVKLDDLAALVDPVAARELEDGDDGEHGEPEPVDLMVELATLRETLKPEAGLAYRRYVHQLEQRIMDEELPAHPLPEPDPPPSDEPPPEVQGWEECDTGDSPEGGEHTEEAAA